MFLRFTAIILLFTFLQACSNELSTQDDFSLAKQAMESREWFYAERLLERYLNTAQDPQKRWEAWKALIATSKRIGSRFGVMRLYYDNMLLEFSEDEAKKKFILYEFANLLGENNDKEAALDMWTLYLGLNNLEPLEAFKATKNTLDLYLQTAQFDSAENALYNCLGMEIPSQDSAMCLYDLADLKAGSELLKEATDLATRVLEVEAYAITHGQAAFLLGDIAQSQGEYEKALEFFEKAIDFYPNVYGFKIVLPN